MIEWTNGLNIGIESLDNEHKNLLRLINKLSNALHHSDSKESINTIFNELINAAQRHAENEEDLLKKCECHNLKEHTQEHASFVESIQGLKFRCLNSNHEDVHEAIDSLFDLLLTHIITEDIPLIDLFEKCGVLEKEQTDNYLFQTLIETITNRVSFTKRVFFSTLIPLIGMFILSFVILISNYYKHEDIKATSSITNIISNVNTLAHALQIERGLGSGYLSSSDDKFKNRLLKQHQIVDSEIKAFNKKLKSINSNNLKSIERHIKSFQIDISSLNSFRQTIKSKKVSQIQEMDFYTNIIKNILNITIKVASSSLDKNIDASISSLSSILQYKEAFGQSRAYGTMLIEEKNPSIDVYVEFMQLLNTQETFLNLFNQTASLSQKRLTLALIDSTSLMKIDHYVEDIKNHKLEGLSSEVWFDTMTQYINHIKVLENQLLQEINILLENKLQDSVKDLFLWIIYILLIVITTLFIIYIFNQSSKKELFQLTDAMKYLADGGRDLRLKPSSLKDALSQMYSAYETTRKKLLRGDVYTQLYKNQQEVELKKQQLENMKLEEIAFIDPLTSCVNRRKFEELSTLELERSIRYKSDLSFLMLDIDHFKSINDTYGHASGDEVLKHFSSICLNLARNIDVVARVGGEEFIVMLPETDRDGAFTFAERFRQKIYDSSFTVDNQTIKYSVSIGIAILDIEKDRDVSSIIQRADSALYEAKESGRNRSVIRG